MSDEVVVRECDIFTIEQLNYIFRHIFDIENERRWGNSKHMWNPSLTKNSIGTVSTFLIKGDTENMIKNILCKFLKPGEFFHNIQYFEWNNLSQINWHPDNNKGSITIYLNEDWDPNWGGFFCWKERDTEKGYMYVPKFNTALVVRGNPPHHVSLISPFAPIRKTLQIWITDSAQLTTIEE